MAYYMDGTYLGENVNQAVGKLTDDECADVAYDYLFKDFDHADLVAFILNLDSLPTCRQLASDALWNLRNYSGDNPDVRYAGVRWLEDTGSWNLVPCQSERVRKAPAKKKTASKPKASGRKPAARASARRY